MKLENVEVSSQGSLALQLHKAKSKSKSRGSHRSSRDTAEAPQTGRAFGTSLPSLLLPFWEMHKGHTAWSPGAPWYARGWVGLCPGPRV